MTGRSARAATAVRLAAGLAVPTLLFYAMRGLGAGLYLALVLPTVLSAVPAVVSLVRNGRVSGLSAYVAAMTLGGLLVSLLPGSTRFLLAKEALMTGVTGVWFLTAPWTSRPLAYVFARPLLEGRLRWPGEWEQLWRASPPFRRMWRVSSAMWGVGLLVDAGLRVLFAFTAPPDRVPALGLTLYVVTLVVLNVVTTVYYVACGVQDPRSALRRSTPVGIAHSQATPSRSPSSLAL